MNTGTRANNSKQSCCLVLFRVLNLALGFLLGTSNGYAQPETYQSILQQPALPRLEQAQLAVKAPSARVTGLPGKMQIVDRSCSSTPTTQVRQAIVNTAVQEWAFFGFQVDNQKVDSLSETASTTLPRWRLSLHPAEVSQVASTVGGYWAAAPGSDWILSRQNAAWQSTEGLAARWRDPWSAAFISWVMCESGLGEASRFQRAIAHHSYIDQAIVARDRHDSTAVYHAFEPGEAEIMPGDMLCSGLRPQYRSLQERRLQLGEGARTHCDIVVDVNAGKGHILTIGGNVRASVRMKIFPAGSDPATSHLAPLASRRIIFAHLKLQTDTSHAATFLTSPTLLQATCTLPLVPVTFAEAGIELTLNKNCG